MILLRNITLDLSPNEWIGIVRTTATAIDGCGGRGVSIFTRVCAVTYPRICLETTYNKNQRRAGGENNCLHDLLHLLTGIWA